jgi:glucosylceramidase
METSGPAVDRRAFLRHVASTSILALSPRWMRAQSRDDQPAVLYVTDTMQRHAAQPALRWSKAAARAPGTTIEIDSTRQYQPVLGFGTALTDSSCYLLSGMPPATRHDFLTEIFSLSGLNLNVGRCCIGASDYSRFLYSYDDIFEDTKLDHFSLKHDEAYILPMLREIRAINPSLFLLASPWSPPGWMKTYGTTFGGRTTENYLDPYAHPLWELSNGSMLGGWMSESYLDVYARYVEKFLDGYARAGVAVDAITSQNEIETTQNGRMPACRWSPHEEAAFIRDHLGPLLRAQNQKTQIWLLDHNYLYWKRVAGQLNDKQLAQYVDGVAWHGYFGTPDQMSLLHQKDPDVPFYWTEGGPFINEPDYATNWAKWAGIFTDVLENWCRCAITWNLMLDPQGKPDLGPYDCGGMVTLKPDGSLLKSGQYHAMRHFSQHLQRDARRIASTSSPLGLRHVAAQNPDGSLTLVITNPGESKDLRVVYSGQQLSFSLPRDAVATLVW